MTVSYDVLVIATQTGCVQTGDEEAEAFRARAGLVWNVEAPREAYTPGWAIAARVLGPIAKGKTVTAEQLAVALSLKDADASPVHVGFGWQTHPQVHMRTAEEIYRPLLLAASASASAAAASSSHSHSAEAAAAPPADPDQAEALKEELAEREADPDHEEGSDADVAGAGRRKPAKGVRGRGRGRGRGSRSRARGRRTTGSADTKPTYGRGRRLRKTEDAEATAEEGDKDKDKKVDEQDAEDHNQDMEAAPTPTAKDKGKKRNRAEIVAAARLHVRTRRGRQKPAQDESPASPTESAAAVDSDTELDDVVADGDTTTPGGTSLVASAFLCCIVTCSLRLSQDRMILKRMGRLMSGGPASVAVLPRSICRSVTVLSIAALACVLLRFLLLTRCSQKSDCNLAFERLVIGTHCVLGVRCFGKVDFVNFPKHSDGRGERVGDAAECKGWEPPARYAHDL